MFNPDTGESRQGDPRQELLNPIFLKRVFEVPVEAYLKDLLTRLAGPEVIASLTPAKLAAARARARKTAAA